MENYVHFLYVEITYRKYGEVSDSLLPVTHVDKLFRTIQVLSIQANSNSKNTSRPGCNTVPVRADE